MMTDTVTNAGLLQTALAAVVTVGSGRGFVVAGGYVITAAHCLPERADGQRLPPPHGFSHTEERTYANLLAPLGQPPSVWCEVLFVDPIADIAILASPDNQALPDEAEAYEALIEAATPLPIGEPPSRPIVKSLGKRARRQCGAFLLSLRNEWFPCTVTHAPNGMLAIDQAAEDIAAGMSGSPIVAEDGTAIGIVCLNIGGPCPRLMGNLPGWFLKGHVS